MKKILILLLVIQGGGLWAQMSADEVISQMDDNRTFPNSRTEGYMTIKDRFGERNSTFIAYSRGKFDSLIEFTSKLEEGQKVLRTKEALYLYFPDAEEVIPMRGSALKQSLLGSDISYEDMTSDRGTLGSYEAKMLGEEEVDGFPCYKIELIAKVKDVAYYKQIIWVDKEIFLTRKGEYFSKSGKLIKEMKVHEVLEQDGYHIPMRTTLSDKLKRDSSTEMGFEEITIGLDLEEDLFTKENLTW